VFLNGTEFNGAVQDYNAIMMPSLNLQNQMNAANNGDNSKAFIDKANTQGWIMAGAYFYDLVKLNGSATANSGATDTNSGLQNSSAVNFTSISSNSTLQGWLGSNSAQLLMQVESLIDGTQLTNSSPGVPATGQSEKPPSVAPDANRVATTGLYSSTVYGYVNNGLMMQIPGQPGVQPLKFANLINFNMSSTPNYFQHQNFSCGNVTTFVFKFCLGRLLGDIFFNVIFLNIFNVFMYIFATFLQQILMAFIMVPIQAFSTIFINGVQTIDTPGANPVVALANMGINYINFAGNLWVTLMGMAAASILFGPFFAFILVLGTPLVFSWLGIMVGIGFTTAYYIPILPYMIFTFGALAWLIAVIEAMVAAPIVALGVTHPEGHDAFGKGEAGVMLLMNVFLRPSLMIIGYISGIALSYVGVWMLNAGYDTAISFMQDPSTIDQGQSGYASVVGTSHYGTLGAASSTSSSTIANYSDWAGVFAWFFSILIYTTMYLTIVQKSFTLISYLPDKVLRWIGGSPESLGTEAAQWGDESVKGKISAGAEKSQDAQQQIAKQAEAKAKEKMGEAKAMGSKATSSGNMSSSPGGGGAGGGDAGGEADGQ
jgi:defect-in-organelle-trafficking protein DotA